jgi:hypothetical protein
MGAPEDPDYVPRMPPHTAPLVREPRWLGWYGVALCVPSCAVAAFGMAAFQAGSSSNGGLVGAAMCALMTGFVGGLLLIHARSKRAWLAAVGGGLAVASVASAVVGLLGPIRVGKSLCERGSQTDCSVLGRTAPSRQERAEYNEKACARGVRGACGRLARDESADTAQRAFDGYCARRAGDYRCSSRDVTSFCAAESTTEYYYSSMCNSDY